MTWRGSRVQIPSGPSENTGFYSCFGLQYWMETKLLGLTLYENFLFGMKAKETKRQYPHRLDKFMTSISLQGTIEEKCNKLYEVANKNVNLFQANVIRFITLQRERIETKEISEGTVCNYVKALKLFCNMNDIMIN